MKTKTNKHLNGILKISCFILYFLNGLPLISILQAQTSPDKIEYYSYSAVLPDNESGFWLVPKPYLTDLDPKSEPIVCSHPLLSTFATPREKEPVTFVIYACRDLKNTGITISDLTSGQSRISSDRVFVRTVMRAPQRENYWTPVEKFVITNRFLPEFKSFDLPSKHLREIWITIDVPDNTPAGIYTGKIKVSANGISQEMPLSLEVLLFKLRVPEKKEFGFYYNTGGRDNKKSDDLIIKELQDIAAHHGSIALVSVPIEYKKTSKGYTPDYTRIKNFLDLVRKAEFPQKEFVIETGLERLSEEITGIRPKNPEDFKKLATMVSSNKVLDATVKKAMKGLPEVQDQYKEYKFVLTHMDEVFNEGRLPLYIELSKLVRKYSDLPLYETFHTLGATADSMRKVIDPYVDIRGNHGYAFEQWLANGHNASEYAKELQQSGDMAWQYHNPISWFINAKWQRLINGLYMWVMPFDGRCDWIYNSYSGDPLNDLDGTGHDFGFAFPLASEKSSIIPTRNYEGWREGIDDLWYIYTLEQLIAEQPQSKKAMDATKWLESVKAKYPDFSQTKAGKRGTPQQSPIIDAMDKTFSFDDLQRIRYTTAQFIISLQK